MRYSKPVINLRVKNKGENNYEMKKQSLTDENNEIFFFEA